MVLLSASGLKAGRRLSRPRAPYKPDFGSFSACSALWQVPRTIFVPKIENARDRSPWRFPDAFAVHRIMHRPVRLCGPGSEFPLSRSLRFGPTLQPRSPCTARLGSYRRRSSELPRPFSLSAVPADGSSSCPDSRIPQLGSEANCQVAPALCFLPCRR